MSKSSNDDSIDSVTLKKLDLLTRMLINEFQVHWTRNNYFVVGTSILLVALSQFKQRLLVEGLISFVGLVFAVAWILFQHRSSRYIGHWKKDVQALDFHGLVIFPEKLGGIQMRKVAYALPVAFSLMWLVIFIALLAGVIM